MATTIGQKQKNNEAGKESADKKVHTFTIIVNNQEFTTEAKQLTGAQIKSLAAIPEDYELFVVHGENSVPVANTEMIHLHERAEFRAIPAGTFGGGKRAADPAR